MSGAVDLRGRKALVTGGTRGIGGAVSARLREAGALALATARTAPREAVDGVFFVAADVTTAEGCETVAAAVRDCLGSLDIVVHVVGGSSAPAGGFAALDDDQWRRALDLNLFPAVRLDRTLLPMLLARGSGGGRAEIDRVAGTIKATHPDFRYQPITEPEELGNGGRIQWISGRPGEAPAYAGTDFIIARDGRIAAVYLFFDKVR